MTELYFICEGIFGLYSCKFKQKTHCLPAFVVLPKYRIFGDYQILYDVFPTFDFGTYKHDFRDTEVNERIKKEEICVE